MLVLTSPTGSVLESKIDVVVVRVGVERVRGGLGPKGVSSTEGDAGLSKLIM